MVWSLKFDIERCCIYTLFTTFRESIYTNTLLVVEEVDCYQGSQVRNERHEYDVEVLLHLHGVKLLIVNYFKCLVPHGPPRVCEVPLGLADGLLFRECLDPVWAFPVVAVPPVVDVVLEGVHLCFGLVPLVVSALGWITFPDVHASMVLAVSRFTFTFALAVPLMKLGLRTSDCVLKS